MQSTKQRSKVLDGDTTLTCRSLKCPLAKLEFIVTCTFPKEEIKDW